MIFTLLIYPDKFHSNNHEELIFVFIRYGTWYFLCTSVFIRHGCLEICTSVHGFFISKLGLFMVTTRKRIKVTSEEIDPLKATGTKVLIWEIFNAKNEKIFWQSQYRLAIRFILGLHESSEANRSDWNFPEFNEVLIWA